MKILMREVGPAGDEGERFIFETEVDVDDPAEAYILGQEFARLKFNLSFGAADVEREIAGDDG